MSRRRIYVAARSEDRAIARSWMDRLREAGWEISHDWTPDVERYVETQTMLSREERIRHSTLDLHGVVSADVLWVLMPAEGGAGVHTELGIALGWNEAMQVLHTHGTSRNPFRSPVVIVSGALMRNIFGSLAFEGYRTHEEAFQAIVSEQAEEKR